MFDDGWDAYREQAFEGAKAKGWIPETAELTPRHPTMPAWDDLPEDQKPFQRRLMEVFAGFGEHADVQAGKVIDEIERLGYGDNTLVVYIWGDDGSSGEGQQGTISELMAVNGIPSTVEQHIEALDTLGGLDVLGSPLVDNMYHAGWAWAGSAPYQGMKLLGRTSVGPGTRWPSDGPRGSHPTRDRDRSSTTATTSCPLSTSCLASRRRRTWMEPPRTRSMG